MRLRLLAAFTLPLASMSSCAHQQVSPQANIWRPGTFEHEIDVGGDDRTYLLHLPSGRRRNRLELPVAYPLVIVLHGSGADGEIVRRQSGMDHLADSLHFAVAYPNGSTWMFGFGSDWNAGNCCGNAQRANVDDVGFLDTIVNDVARHVSIDRRRVYVAGFSDGGRMAYRAGCQSARTFAAIGVVSGSLVADPCAPARAVPLIAFHGTADTEVGYRDSVEAKPARALVAASSGLPPSVRFWAAENQCQRVAVRRDAPHVVRAQFAPCAAEVAFFSIDSGAHAWPGGAKDGDDGFEPTHEIRASDLMIAFFFRHPLR